MSTAADTLTAADVEAAARRIAGRVRPLAVAPPDPRPGDADPSPGAEVWFALEFLQHTGTFKARGAANFAAFHRENGTMPAAGVTIASGGNAGLAAAWAAAATGTPATVFVPATAPQVKVDRLRGYGADVRLVGTEYADALAASVTHAEATGALLSHAYDNPLIAAGAGTCARELHAHLPSVDTVVVAVGGGGLFAGFAAALLPHGIRVVAVEPETSRALNAALLTGTPVDVPVTSIAADSLGARRASATAVALAAHPLVTSVTVPDQAIVDARRWLWEHRRIASEYGGATALAGLLGKAYVPAPGERVAVVLCGANTDPATLV